MNIQNCYFPTKFRYLLTFNIVRVFLSGFLILQLVLIQLPILAQKSDPVKLSWLGEKSPLVKTGVNWGVPLPEGKYKADVNFSLQDNNNKKHPLQSWPMAYWPDGSLKWIGLGTVVDTNSGSTFELSVVEKNDDLNSKDKIHTSLDPNSISINNGSLNVKIPLKGNELISSILLNDKEISSGGKLICILQDGANKEYGDQPSREKFISNIDDVDVEQDGPIRAVIKIEGNHISDNANREWLPFVVRLYFYAGVESIRMVHTIIYDGDQEKDFIKGIGLEFAVPLDEQIYNRHIRFSGDDGRLWDEPSQPLNGRRPFYVNKKDLYVDQLLGKRIPEYETFSEHHQFLINHWATWNDFKLEQLNADGFVVKKRTNDQSTWIDAGHGKRSTGLAFVGDVSGGLALSIKDFWQSYPSTLEIKNVTKDTAKLNAWLWSPQAEAMDMRHYDTVAWGHNLLASYEDVQPGFSIATGVARTSEIMIHAYSEIPSNEELSYAAHQGNNTPLLTATPQYFHSVPTFGIWSLPKRETEVHNWIEDQLDNAFKYYQLEIEQRHWYGFWHYGDIMHAYDHQRHSWKYDMGGFAWDNTELMPNMWLWYSYLRSGREDIFRMAEAMTRHNGEVDVYHLGKFKGLGSRHNVIHWGGGAKEVRISQAALGRFYYYLTTDERTGDLMRASVEASNEAIGKLDPLRLILEKGEHPTHARIGPDWLALVGNWMTEWERTGDTIYRDRIMTGINNFSDMPYGFFSGKNGAFGYDPQNYTMHQLHDTSIGFSHLSVLMGGPEISYELTTLLDDDKWNKLWLQFCKLYSSPIEVIEKEFDKSVELGNPGPWYARLPAYYSRATRNKSYAKKAWKDFLEKGNRRYHINFDMNLYDDINSLQPIYEVKRVSTNTTAQWSLNAIQLLELVGDSIPEKLPE